MHHPHSGDALALSPQSKVPVMKSSRGILVWSALALCAVLVIGAMTWLTRGVMQAGRERIKADQERIAAENRADLEERTRLALWRMDALGAAVVLKENRIPAETYDSSLAPDGRPEVLLHFQLRKDSAATSPEHDDADKDGPMAERMARLRALLAANPLPGDEWAQLNGAVIEGENAWQAVPKDAAKEQAFNSLQRQNMSNEALRKDETYQTYSNLSERAQRAKAVGQTVEIEPKAAAKQSAAIAQQADAGAEMFRDPPARAVAPQLETGQMRAVWLGGELFLLRQVFQTLADGRKLAIAVQGVWLDSLKLRQQLLAEVADLLPKAELLPADGKHAAEDPLTMVSFPFRLERNELLAMAAIPSSPPVGAPLLVAWGAVALAVLTSSLLVRGIMRLSERRASFVSAVTHELRTPLTTFRLYSDMLESGAVKAEKRGDYLRVLSREADRLSHLVENVLAFSRIERGNARSIVREATVGALLEESRDRLEARLATAGLVLEMDSSCALRVRADTAAVEHILFNLVDNAAKYAAAGDPPLVRITARGAGRLVEILVSDHGPGIPGSERGRIFRAFHKSAREAAESKPGVGLGLALSRRLAREQGGDLVCTAFASGASFVLRLPQAGVAR
jgi:signal transduction histidine kinase